MTRLDEALVTRALSSSRSRARDQINRGCVTVNGIPARKPSQSVADDDHFEIVDEAKSFVSRASVKLVHALDEFEISADGKYCFDIGASTGGFTQVLLQRGARHVVAVDVGHGQMVAEIVENPRVTLFEGLNARDVTADILAEPPGLIVADVSFISLKLALPRALSLAGRAADLVALIKPQFEVGRDNLPGDGVVKDEVLHQRVCTDIRRFLEGAGWRVPGIMQSPISGGHGNLEFLIAARKA